MLLRVSSLSLLRFFATHCASRQLVAPSAAPPRHSADRSSSSSPARSTQRTATTSMASSRATIESGWHINSNKPLDDFVIPTKLSFDGTPSSSPPSIPPHTVRTLHLQRRTEARRLRRNDPDPVHRETEERRTRSRQAALPGLQRQRLPAAARCRGRRSTRTVARGGAAGSSGRHRPASRRSPPRRKAPRPSRTIASPPRTPSTDCR